MIKSILLRIKVLFRKLFVSRRLHKKSVHNTVPYFSQFESTSLIKKILTKKITAADDPLWRKSGAKDPLEYTRWSWNGCGMACLKMVLAYKTKKVYPIVTLGKKCRAYGGYSKTLNEGLIYAPFLKFLSKEFHIDARIYSPMILRDILFELQSGKLIIASVSPHIDTPKSHADHSGGHLILVIGYDLETKTLFVHDPSGQTTAYQKNTPYTFTHFENFFAFRGIAI